MLVIACASVRVAGAADRLGTPRSYGPPVLRGDAPSTPRAATSAAAPELAAPAGARPIRFDAVTFDPLKDGEPDASRTVPESPEFEALDSLVPRLALVQFDHAPGGPERAALLAQGVTPLFYVPEDAYVVRGDLLALSRAAGLAGVRWTGRFRPLYKVNHLLQAMVAGRVPHARLPGEGPLGQAVDLLLAPGASVAETRAALERAIPGLEVLAASEDTDPGLLTLRLAHARLGIDLAAAANLENVAAVLPHGEILFHNDNAAWIGQSYDTINRQTYSKSATIWNRGLLGEGELIAIADSGVDPDVCWTIDTAAGLPVTSRIPATGANRGPIPVDLTRRKIVAYNLLGTFQAQATPYDTRTGDPHGTWCAVSAAGDNPDNTTTESNPTARHHDAGDGMAPLAKLIVEDIGDDTGKLVGLGLPIPTIIDQLFEQERDAGARISTNSWGVDGNAYDVLAFFADRMVWNHPDFLLVVSAGNSGPAPKTLASPATAKNVVTVGASEARPSPAENLDPENVADFSSRGPTSDGRQKPDLVMSGKALITGNSDHAEVGRTCATYQVNGTSFSAPVTAGFAALVREYFRKGYYPTGTRRADDGFLPSAALVKGTLVAGARNMAGRGGTNLGPCNLDTCDLSVGLCRVSFLGCQQDSDCYKCAGNSSFACSNDRDCDLTLLQDDAPSIDQGWGRLHLDDALFFPGDQRGLAVWDVPRSSGIATGETWRSQFYTDGRAQDLQVVLTWTDPPAFVASPSYLVNNLDLHVVAPDGKEYWGNGWGTRDRSPLSVNYTQQSTRPASDVDNLEMVRIASYTAPAGVWTVEVIGKSVPGSPWVDGGARQDFAVVAVGPLAANGGSVRFLRPRWSCAGNVDVEVLDQNAGSPLSVTLTTSSGDSQSLTLTALGGGRFRGSVPVASGLPITAANGRLEVADNDTLTATYTDANPAHVATATSTIACDGSVTLGTPVVTGGCDGDGYLDAGEEVDLQVPIVNPGPADLTGVTATLVAGDGRLFVARASAQYGNLAAGTSSVAAIPFHVALADSVAPLTVAALRVLVKADGWTQAQSLPLALTLQADRTLVQGTYTEDFSTVPVQCNDGKSNPPAGSWYWFDLNQDCATSETTWSVGNCFGSRQVMLPSCTGQILGTANERHHRLVSPQITTGVAGSTTVLKRLRFLENYHFKINLDGKPCDREEVQVFTNRDARTVPSGYYRDRSADGTDQTADLDPSTVSDWTLPPLPDASELQLIFHSALHDPNNGAGTCTGGTGVEVRWRVDNVQLDYENVLVSGDVKAACVPGCAAPAVPVSVTAASLAGGSVVIGWDPVAGAQHYDVYRRTGDGDVFLGRATAPDSAFVARPDGNGPFTFVVRAVDATGLCPSAPSGAVAWSGAQDCHAVPPAPTSIAAQSAAVATCRADVSWAAVTPPCGGPVTYRVYRSLDPNFVPAPGSLVAETASTAWSDTAATPGWDSRGEPIGDLWTYEVRAVDGQTGLEGAGARATTRAGGPSQLTTWTDDAGDARPSKMTSFALADLNHVGAAWTRSPVALHHSGSWSYWPDRDPFGQGQYPSLTCLALESPAVLLDPAGGSQLVIWANYQIEYQYDGIVVEAAGDNGVFAPIAPLNGYPSTFAKTVPPPCQGTSGGSTGEGPYINACGYAPTQGAITGPANGGRSGWRQFTFSLASFAGQNVRFRVKLSTDCGTSGGAVLDDLSISNARLATACTASSCAPAPTFAGLLSALDADPAQPTGIHLTWGTPASWGGGGAGSFEIWRDGTRVATVPAASRAYDDTTVEPNVDHVYEVIAVSGSACGLRSAGAGRITARDCGPLGEPQREDARLDVLRSPTSIVLRAQPIAGAGSYRFRWALAPDAVGTSSNTLDASVPEARHAVLLDGQGYFYLAEDGPVSGCP